MLADQPFKGAFHGPVLRQGLQSRPDCASGGKHLYLSSLLLLPAECLHRDDNPQQEDAGQHADIQQVISPGLTGPQATQ